MKKLINKTQQKIYAIWRKAKQHISSFIGGQFKKRLSNILFGDFMNWNLKDWGDPLEKKALVFIETNGLGGYKNFWNNFVGNVGNKPAPLKEYDTNKDNKRQLLAQWNYTILQNTYLIHLLLKDRYKTHKISKNNLKDVLHYDRDFILVTHLTYNNIELLDKIRNLIKNKKGDEFYVNKHIGFVSFRNSITHNIKALTRISHHYEVPKNLEWFIEKGKDSENFIWTNNSFFKGLEYQPINEYMNYCIQTIITDFKEILTEEYTYCDTLFKQTPKNEIVDVSYVRTTKTEIRPSSGTTIQY